jgi:ribosome-binding factor A
MSIRTERLSAVIRQDLGDILRDYQHGAIVSVTQVSMTPDLGLAKIYLSIFGQGRQEAEVFKHILSQQAEIRNALAQKIRHQVRRIPELKFYIDDTAEYVNRIEQVFSKIKQQREEQEQKVTTADDAKSGDME